MRLSDGFFWVSRSVLSQRQRSLLTALGIAIGIAAVALLTSVGEGLRVYLLDMFSAFGTRIVTVTAGKTTTQGMVGMVKTVRPLTETDAEALRKLPHVKSLVAYIQGTVRVDGGDRQRNTQLLGVTPEVPQTWNMHVALGRFLPDDSAARPYVVLGYKVRRELFGDANPLGASVRVGEYRFRVIGVMESKGQMLGIDLDDVVYVPTARALQLLNREGVGGIDIAFDEQTTSAEMSKRIARVLIALHGEEDFTLFTQEDMLASLNRILKFITLAIAGLGSISLIVGGVGIVTIMTIAVTERTNEIGLLVALGARRRTILGLFLGEAIALAALGGLLGLAAGIGIAQLIHLAVPALPVSTPWHFVVLAELSALVIGLAAGVLPARKAARLDPVEALRAE